MNGAPMDDRARVFWATQTRSGQPVSEEWFFKKEAQEHAQFMGPIDRLGPTIDFACGAGELLAPFAELAGVTVGLDFSSSMLSEARLRLGQSPIELIEGNGLLHAQRADQPVWATCEGMNQYLDPNEIVSWVSSFVANPRARSLYLFDCVDPLLYRVLRPANRYRKQEMPPLRALRWRARMLKMAIRNVGHKDWARLDSSGMGYGYTPGFFRALAEDLSLDYEFAASQQFEYRFHVALRKEA